MDEILDKLEDISQRLKKIEQNIAPLGLLNIYDNYSNLGGQYWLSGAIQDIERHSEATGQANGYYLDCRNKEENEYLKSKNSDPFQPSDEVFEKMMASSCGVVVNSFLKKEFDKIRAVYINVLNEKMSIEKGRAEAERIIDERPVGLSRVVISPEFVTHLDEHDSIFGEIKAYNDERILEEQGRWAELSSPEGKEKRFKLNQILNESE